jgi:hypothetical protein
MCCLVQHIGIEIGPVRPNDRSGLRVDADLGEEVGVLEGGEDPASSGAETATRVMRGCMGYSKVGGFSPSL